MLEEQNNNEELRNENEVEVNENNNISIDNNQNIDVPDTNIVDEKKTGNLGLKPLYILNIIALLAIGVLFVLFFTQNKTNKTSKNNNSSTSSASKSNNSSITIAYVNTDSLLTHYQYAKDFEKDMEAYEKKMNDNFMNQMMTYQRDVENYQKTAPGLTLSEQNRQGEALMKRKEELAGLEGKLMKQIQDKHVEERTKLLNAVYAFIRDYNEKNGKYTVILKKSFADTPVLYIDEGMDITNEIIEGLNEEYKLVKQNKK